MRKLSCLVLVLFAPSMVRAEEKTFLLSAVKRVNVVNASGSVTIRSAKGDHAVIHIDKRTFESGCELTMELQAGTLVAKAEASSHSFFKKSPKCEADLSLEIPRKVNLEFRIGSGEVIVDTEIGEVDGASGNGDLTIRGMTSGGKLRTGNGDIHLTYASAPKRGSLDIKTGSGNAEILLPIGSKIKTDFMAGSGKLSNELGDSQDGDFEILMKAGAGSLRIKKI